MMLWIATQCSHIGSYQHFTGICCFHLQGNHINQRMLLITLASITTSTKACPQQLTAQSAKPVAFKLITMRLFWVTV